jgi:hypothetical protein
MTTWKMWTTTWISNLLERMKTAAFSAGVIENKNERLQFVFVNKIYYCERL